MDIATMAEYVTKWLIPSHPNQEVHRHYLDRGKQSVETFLCDLSGRPGCLDDFLDGIDGVVYVEHPIYRRGHFGGYDLIDELEERCIPVFGIPMWEWWPEDASWALKTNALWSVTKFTNNYLNSLATVLHARGLQPKWSPNVYGDRWGINISDFPFRQREKILNVVFVRGNAGYKDRKASDIILPTLESVAAKGVSVLVYTQAPLPQGANIGQTLAVNHATFPNRQDVYKDGDLFIFCSYWEGLCHGIYEACASGSLVATTNYPPMDECLPAFKVPVSHIGVEKLGKTIAKAVIDSKYLEMLILDLYNKNVSELSLFGSSWIRINRSLESTLQDMYQSLVGHI